MNPNNILSIRTAESLSQMILEGRFAPGDRLPGEPLLARELGISRTTLREAIRILSTRGLLEVRRGAGTFVTRSERIHEDFELLKIRDTHVSLKDLYEMRLMFEPQAAYYAALRASDQEIAAILDYGEALGDIIRRRDPRWDELEQKFHNAIASAAHNQFITVLLPIFNRAIRQGVILANEDPVVADHSLGDHRLIMQYLRDRNPIGARAAMHLHMLNTMRDFRIEID